jgi:hypothetical protein
MSGELLIAEMLDKGWFEEDLEPKWESQKSFFVLSNLCLFKFKINDYDDFEYITLKDLSFTSETIKG